MNKLTLRHIRTLYERYVPQISRHPGTRERRAPLWWPAHEIGHLLTVPRQNIGLKMFGLDHEGTSYKDAYELAAMSISRRLLTNCGRPDLFYDRKIGELEASDYDVVHYGSQSRARGILRRRRLLRLPGTRQGLEALCQKALLEASRTRLTWEQIRARYPDQWVVLTAQNSDSRALAQSGTAVVISHGDTRAEALEAAPAAITRHGDTESRYTGSEIQYLATIQECLRGSENPNGLQEAEKSP